MQLSNFPSTTCWRNCFFFLIFYSCLLCQRLFDHKCLDFWALHSVSLIPMSVFVLVRQCFDYCSIVILSDIWGSYFFCIIFSAPQDCFGLFLDYLFYLCEKCHGEFDRDCIKFIDYLRQYGHFTILILPIEYGVSFHFLESFLVSLTTIILSIQVFHLLGQVYSSVFSFLGCDFKR